jgi:hypothetical protein
VDGELEAALADSAGQFAGLAGWVADEARYLDHAEREEAILEEGRKLELRLLQATYKLDTALEERFPQVTSAGGIRHGTVETGQERVLETVFGPVKVERMAYRNRREPNLYPADARQAMPADPYSMGMRALAARHLAAAGYAQAQGLIEDRTGTRIGHAQLAGIARDLAAWTDDFCEERARDAEEDLPATGACQIFCVSRSSCSPFVTFTVRSTCWPARPGRGQGMRRRVRSVRLSSRVCRFRADLFRGPGPRRRCAAR